jgi:hypothetical protein
MIGRKLAGLAFCFLAAIASAAAQQFKPYRVLLVISNQWKDPASFLVSGGGEFQTLVTMLKSWGIPCDILRLDQVAIDPNRFTDFDGHPKYGAILWDVTGDTKLSSDDEMYLREAVEQLHISLIALGNRIQQPEIQRLLGLHYLAEHMHSSHTMVSGDSYILRGLGPDLDQNGPPSIVRQRVQAQVTDAVVLAAAGGMPQTTERDLGHDTRAIWIGGDIDQMLLYQPKRSALRRSIAEAIGYALEKTWTNKIVLTMDDMGNAQNSWLEHWHYPTLSEEQIRKYMIEPLKAHHAVLSLNIVPGFVDDARRRIVPTWKQQFTDAFGTKQDYVSAKRGLDAGIAEGVFEIESHGWTHMQADLTSAPGPWWGAPLDGERAEVGWYREFFDIRRNKEIPAAEQKFRMQQSHDWIQAEFGIEPLEFSTGGNGVSRTWENNTWRIAAEVGYGYYGGYLGKDLAVEGRADSNADFGGTDDVPLLLPALPDGHDRGVSHDPPGFAKVFDLHPGADFIGLDEYIGYQHAALRTSPGATQLKISIDYDRHYCRALAQKGSTWDLEVADWLRRKIGQPKAWVDGKEAGMLKDGTTVISMPPGTGTHTVEVR